MDKCNECKGDVSKITSVLNYLHLIGITGIMHFELFGERLDIFLVVFNHLYLNMYIQCY